MFEAANIQKPIAWAPGHNRLAWDLWRDCVLCLPLWEGSGAHTGDLSPYGNHGTKDAVNTEWRVDFPGITHYQARAITNYIAVPDDASLEGMAAVSLFSYVKWTGSVDVNEDTIISKYKGVVLGYLFRWDSQTSKIEALFLGPGAGGGFNNTDISDGRWHSVLATYDGATIRAYLDGVASPTTYASAGAVGTNEFDVYVANAPHNKPDSWRGYIAIAAIWRRALQPSEAVALAMDPFCMIRPCGG